MTHEVGKLRQDMGTIFQIVSGLHQLASAREGGSETVRREFQKGFAEGAGNLAALRVDVGETVGMLVCCGESGPLTNQEALPGRRQLAVF